MFQKEIDEIKIRAGERSKIYMLLSHFFLERPEEGLLEKLKGKDFILYIKKISDYGEKGFKEPFKYIESFIKRIEDLPDEKILEELQVDFTKLTRGIKKGYGPPPPYESMWRGENVLMGEWTQRVLRFYYKAQIGMDLKNNPPDHIGIELKFMSLLCYREKEKWENEDVPSAFEVLKMEKDFIEEHLLAWSPFYLERMLEEAETDFYRGIAVFTKNFLYLDKGMIDEIFEIKGGEL